MARLTLPLLASLFFCALSPVAAQTYTSCNPLNETDCPSDMALGMSATFHFNSTPDSNVWNTTAGTVTYDASTGAAFTVSEKGDAPTIQSNFYIFFGRVEVWLKAASGTGIISSIVLESDDLDEVDWEFIGGNDTTAETNYFGKGNTTSYDRAIYYDVNSPQGSYHNYTTIWTQEKLEWYIDGTWVRTLNYADANSGNNFPQTPMNLRIGIWAGGDSDNSEGTIEWAGGETDYDNGPYTMYVMNVTVEDYSSGSEYSYGDTSGSYSSIDITDGTSTVAKDITEDLATGTNSDGNTNTTASSATSTSSSSSSSSTSSSSSNDSDSESSISKTWDNMSSGAKIGVYAGAGAAALAIVGLAAYCCRRHRRDGKKELLMQEEKFRAERDEYEAYQMQMRSGTFSQQGGTDHHNGRPF